MRTEQAALVGALFLLLAYGDNERVTGSCLPDPTLDASCSRLDLATRYLGVGCADYVAPVEAACVALIDVGDARKGWPTNDCPAAEVGSDLVDEVTL